MMKDSHQHLKGHRLHVWQTGMRGVRAEGIGTRGQRAGGGQTGRWQRVMWCHHHGEGWGVGQGGDGQGGDSQGGDRWGLQGDQEAGRSRSTALLPGRFPWIMAPVFLLIKPWKHYDYEWLTRFYRVPRCVTPSTFPAFWAAVYPHGGNTTPASCVSFPFFSPLFLCF